MEVDASRSCSISSGVGASFSSGAGLGRVGRRWRRGQLDKHGGHIMLHSRTHESIADRSQGESLIARIENIEVRYAGQLGRLGRFEEIGPARVAPRRLRGAAPRARRAARVVRRGARRRRAFVGNAGAAAAPGSARARGTDDGFRRTTAPRPGSPGRSRTPSPRSPRRPRLGASWRSHSPSQRPSGQANRLFRRFLRPGPPRDRSSTGPRCRCS